MRRWPADQRRKRKPNGSIVAEAARAAPLDYMLEVMRDVNAPAARRDRMAIAAAPFCHPRAADVHVGKKEQAQVNAETAHVGNTWDRLLS